MGVQAVETFWETGQAGMEEGHQHTPPRKQRNTRHGGGGGGGKEMLAYQVLPCMNSYTIPWEGCTPPPPTLPAPLHTTGTFSPEQASRVFNLMPQPAHLWRARHGGTAPPFYAHTAARCARGAKPHLRHTAAPAFTLCRLPAPALPLYAVALVNAVGVAAWLGALTTAGSDRRAPLPYSPPHLGRRAGADTGSWYRRRRQRRHERASDCAHATRTAGADSDACRRSSSSSYTLPFLATARERRA